MFKIAGRSAESLELERYYKSNKAKLVVVYGRRRVGKTYLINRFFDNNFFFHITGKHKEKKKAQIKRFVNELTDKNNKCLEWDDAFDLLRKKIEKSFDSKKKVIFIDEISWFDTKKSGFLSAFEYFWNHFCSTRDDVLLIVCGSSSSWITKSLFKNKGGLYNRINGKIYVQPFTLSQTKEYFEERKVFLSNRQILDLYMVFGGIPYYLDYFNYSFSVVQNIDRILFSQQAVLKNEYDDVFNSLFDKNDKYKNVVNVLANKVSGLTRKEIVLLTNLQDNGQLTDILENLELSGFIRKFSNYPQKKKEAIYQLIDNFSLFYNKVIKKAEANDTEYWAHSIISGKYYSWRGYAFENVCFQHIHSIKKSLGISGFLTTYYAWKNASSQIDLVIERVDKAINLCEIKYTDNEYSITKNDYLNIQNKITQLSEESKKNKGIIFTLISSNGLKENQYSNIVQAKIELEDLFL
ncbi:MAG: AAA family ATPase [Bacillales bacterium]|jgi:AAA+ ATPase superfamily predicted ATPase|nr:AAA family ATPase [Bacillales bacterium]